MAFPRRKWLAHEVPPWVLKGAVYFVTINCHQRGRNVLCTKQTAEKLFSAVHFYCERGQWSVRLFLLMPDHLHCLVAIPPDKSLLQLVVQWKRFTARVENIAWQRGFFDHRVRSDASCDEIHHYIRQNPVRKGLVARDGDWPWYWPQDS